jgi:hypothetical protein
MKCFWQRNFLIEFEGHFGDGEQNFVTSKSFWVMVGRVIED